MNRFDYVRPSTLEEAFQELAAIPDAKLLAGGTNLVDLMKYDVAKPTRLVDINRLPLDGVEELDDGGLRLGALVPNADAAYDPRVQARAPLLASAILAGASAQLRNVATTGGNLLQRTRCAYFYDPCMPCNKREPGTGCPAIGGVNRMHAVFGASEHCIAVHPSDMCVALAALDARVNVASTQGARVIAFQDFHRLPGDAPQKDTTLASDEIITSVDLPADRFGVHHSYLKLRDRLSYAFALVSVAAALRIEDGKIAEACVALGGVAHKPWRDVSAEAQLVGLAPDRAAFETFAQSMMSSAVGRGENDFKIELGRRAITRALSQAAAGTPQSQAEKQVL